MAKKKKELTRNQLELENEVQKSISQIYDNKDKKVKSTANIRKLIPYYTKYKGLFISFILLMIVYIVVSFLEPIIAAEILEYLVSHDFNNVIRYAIYYLIGGATLGILLYLISQVRIRLTFNVKFDLRQGIVNSISRLTMRKLDEINSGVLISRIETDSAKCSSTIVNIINESLNLINTLVFFLYIAFINIYFFLLMLVYVVVKYLIDAWRFGIWRKNSKISRKRGDIAHSVYFEQVRGIRDVKTLNLRDNMMNVSAEKVKYAYEIDKKINTKINTLYYALSFPLGYIVEFALIIAGVFLIKAGIIAFPAFMVVYMYKGRAFSVASYITALKDSVTEGELSAERYFDIAERTEKEEFGDIDKHIEVGQITLKNVRFAYDEKMQVLKGINLNIKPNSMIAIVGKSGGGKSTLLSILGKMYVPNSGEVILDGINLNDLTENSLRNAIGIVNQDPYIFNASIRNNLLYVKPDATEKELWEALDSAQIGNYVRKLDKGIDSMVGENGVKVSGGQKQRLAIARALLKGNKVLIFDEATSALDNTSQSAIVNALEKLKKNHTIIVVAHRLSTIVDADNIVVLDGGKVAAEGTHDELLKSCKIYQELYMEEENDSKL